MGKLNLVCQRCQEKQTIELPALNDMDYTYEVVEAPTATADGYGSYTWNVTDYGTYTFYVVLRHAVADKAMQVVIDSTTVVVGNTIRLEVQLKNNTGLWGMIMRLDYDQSVLTLVDVENGDLLSTLDIGWDYNRLMWTADDQTTDDGVLCVLEFQVAEDALVGDYPITMILEQSFDGNGQRVKPELVSSVVKVINVIYGDVNDDGLVDLMDVLMLRRYLVNIDPDTGLSSIEVGAGADANGDGTVDLMDVLMLRRYLVNIDPATGESTIVLGP
jgi:hypothetical protein